MGNDYDSNPFAGEDLSTKEKELEAKEAELNQREEELKKKEDTVTRGGIGVEEKNWPPFFPLIHHDIPKEIPVHLQRTQYVAFTTLLGLCVCLIWNLVAVTTAWFEGADSEIWFLAVIYLLIGIPGAYILWYRPLYRAMRTNGALMFVLFFFTYSCHLFFCVYASIAPPLIFEGESLTGILPALDILPVNGLVGCVYLIGFALFALESLISLWVIQDVFRYFCSSGRAEEAKREVRRSSMMVALGHG
ncbi:hypothetical protein M8C21_025164 [Ambrosia artemisiifolia]|uniref:Secretory carrier-associated membrane protein n=1 Tax=Ambrosia artemisiifolia TaxID=4212 RepID=A0AAD5D5F9_AMBAR|nr:hypothetical protein M8C21_025164 [Ambrosia artemisiifolia]